MNRQRKVLITITYNELWIIIDTKAEEVAQPDLQPTCNQLATDCISRQMAIDAVEKKIRYTDHDEPVVDWNDFVAALCFLPSAQPRMTCDGCKYANHPTGWSDVCVLCIRNFRNFTDRYER